jgi:oligoendopeptidase F
MHRTARVVLWAVLAAVPVMGQGTPERSQVPEKERWNLADIYPTDEAWRAAKLKVEGRIPEVERFKGRLAESPAQLLAALEALHDVQKELSRVYVYASMLSDQDTRDAAHQAMKQEVSQLATRFQTAVAFVEPEILKMDRATVQRFQAQEKKLAVYARFIEDVLRRQAHTGTESEERIIAQAGQLAATPGEVYTLFTNSDFPYPSARLKDGREVTLDQPTFLSLRPAPDRDDRQLVFSVFFGALGRYRSTFGANLNGALQRDVFLARARKYDTAMEAALDANHVPVSVYASLVDGVNASLPTFHRYLKLRARMMGIAELHYYDLYAPLVPGLDRRYTLEEARALVTTASRPLGEDYVAVLHRAFDERWLDLHPTAGKRSGAYSQGGAYDVHPYMLLNYNGRYNDVSTLTHELGHTMQSYYSNKTQPYATAGYPIFVAEVASTFNEALLLDHVLKQTKDDATRLTILGEALEGIKATVFRQTQLAEFEMRAHEMAEKGQPITGESLDELYMAITKKYYGHDQGVCVVDPEIAHEWAFIPHLYFNFYVFQYATSYTASAALSEKVLAGDAAATARFRQFLAAGGSKDPVALLKDAGVDMTTQEPLQLTMKKMNRIMDEMEAILARRPAGS